MAEQTSKNNETKGGFSIGYIFRFAGVVLLLLSIISFSPGDLDIISGGSQLEVKNWIGRIGAYLSAFLFYLVGLAAYFIPLLLLQRVIRVLFKGGSRTVTFIFSTLMVVFGLVILLGLFPESFAPFTAKLGIGHSGVPQAALAGGVIGQFLGAPAVKGWSTSIGIFRAYIGVVGSSIIGLSLFVAGSLLIYLLDWHNLVKNILGTYVFGESFSDETSSAPRKSSRRTTYQETVTEEDEEGEDDEEEIPQEDVQRKKKTSFVDALTLVRDKFKKSDKEESSPEAKDDDYVDNESRNSRFADRQARFTEEDNFPNVTTQNNYNQVSDAPISNTNNLAASVPEQNNQTSLPTGPASTAKMVTPDVSTKVTKDTSHVTTTASDYVLPPISMLAKGTDVVGENLDAITHAKEILQQTLDSFQIPGRVSNYISGPRVTRFEITLDPGINVKKVEQIQDNIAMNLSATSVRVLAPIPGRPVVGVEISNSKPEAVFMRSVMESDIWKSGKAEIPIALGKDVAGNAVVLDLAKAPHLLIAGSTGTGKSVCTNSLIVSLLFRFRPDELKLIMVDPKIVEFEDYKNLPHLLTPIINDYSKVPIALRWAVNEMERRYRILANAGVKKLSEFNSRPDKETPIYDEDGQLVPPKLPVLIVIIDELADLMMTEAKKDAETSITRIAQKGRAAGIHIVVATQRPSTNVITGVIKANLPTRFCFQVRSMVDSRVVLDTNGAEKLLGQGDMLFMSPASMNIERVQGAWVKDSDIKEIVKFVSNQVPQNFNDNVLASDAESAEEGGNGKGKESTFSLEDDMDDFGLDEAEIGPIVRKYLRPGDSDVMKRALEVIIVDRQASTSYIQRRLRIGYNRAAEIMDQLQERGIVGPPSGSGNKREILIFDGLEIN